MKREDIEITDKGRLEELDGSDNLLVSFGGIRQGLGIPVFEFFNSIKDVNCDKIYLRDFNQAWYQKGVDNEINDINEILSYLRGIINDNRYKNICFLGNSMGGYAAILFGSLLEVKNIIAFAPQTFIDKWNRLKYFDRRWKEQLSEVYNYTNRKSNYFDLKKVICANTLDNTSIEIFYSPNHRLDKMHAERLKGLKGITLNPILNGGHSVVKVLRDNGELKRIICSSFVHVE